MRYTTQVEVDVYDVLDSLSSSELDDYLNDIGHKGPKSQGLFEDVEYFEKVVDKIIHEMKNGYTDEATELLIHLEDEVRKSLTK